MHMSDLQLLLWLFVFLLKPFVNNLVFNQDFWIDFESRVYQMIVLVMNPPNQCQKVLIFIQKPVFPVKEGIDVDPIVLLALRICIKSC